MNVWNQWAKHGEWIKDTLSTNKTGLSFMASYSESPLVGPNRSWNSLFLQVCVTQTYCMFQLLQMDSDLSVVCCLVFSERSRSAVAATFKWAAWLTCLYITLYNITTRKNKICVITGCIDHTLKQQSLCMQTSFLSYQKTIFYVLSLKTNRKRHTFL